MRQIRWYRKHQRTNQWAPPFCNGRPCSLASLRPAPGPVAVLPFVEKNRVRATIRMQSIIGGRASFHSPNPVPSLALSPAVEDWFPSLMVTA